MTETQTATTAVEPRFISREEIVAMSEEVLNRPDLPLTVTDDFFRIQSLGLDWDIASKVYQPADETKVPTGPDGKKIGIFLLHGGAGDHRSKDPMARFLASKFGYKVANMSYPGRFNFATENADWPGDTIDHEARTARIPMWTKDQEIGPDQYEMVEDSSNPVYRAKWGTLYFLKAKEGTEFYDRLAAWPQAFEEAMIAVCERNFPTDEFSIYVHGHSTGGPFVHILLQRVDNIAGLLGMESSQWGFLYPLMLDMTWDFPFDYFTLRSWRHLAMYAGPEAGPEGMWRLPWLMEDVLEKWDKVKSQPQFKAEYIVTYGATESLAEAARAAAKRLQMNDAETVALVERFTGYARELSGPGVKPVPPLLYGIAKGSRDHTLERYRDITLREAAKMTPAPRTKLIQFQAGVHSYERPEEDLPRGVLPAVTKWWDDEIREGFFVV
ncbi:MAG: hypothetical protein K0S78_752 [Thermomicrobiales bacterium]|nr:hypothetical protein [Thermomicrobiales bacterium]